MMSVPKLEHPLYPSLVAEDWPVPEGFQESGWLLVPTGPVLARVDLEAVQVSQSLLHHLFRPEDDWPGELNLEANRADLAWHAREFRARRSFTYSILTAGYDCCLGCLYLYPSLSPVHEAEAYLWVRADLPTNLARRVETTIEVWVDTVWPFSHVAWPGRQIPWAYWQHFRAPSYDVHCRRGDAE